MRTIEQIVNLYHNADITPSELRIELMRRATKENIEELLGFIPETYLSELKEDALCGQYLKVFWMGASSRQLEEASNEFNRGLGILREHLHERSKT